jgi:spore coat polysaccharide biosynthesis protein SpsF
LRTLGIIQARMGSARLPGKVMMPLSGTPMLEHLIRRVGAARTLSNLVVATSHLGRDDSIAELCSRVGIACFRGSETDVLGRFVGALSAAPGEFDAVVRLTGDNPFVGADLVDLLVERLAASKPPADYATTLGHAGYPPGLTVEAILVSALRVAAQSTNPEDREHVTWHIRQRPDQFVHVELACPESFGPQNFSIDTPDDYARLAPLFAQLHAHNPEFGIRETAAALTPEPRS